MIEYIKGELTEITPAMAVVECNGLGYGINVSLNTYSAIQGKKEVKLYIYEAIREDAYVLYGFASKQGVILAPHQRIGHRRKHSTDDSLCPHSFGALQCNQQRQR